MGVKDIIDKPGQLGGIYVLMESAINNASYKRIFKDLLKTLQKDHASYFAEEKSSTGDEWPDLAAITIKRKGHDKILYETGRLLKSLTTGNQDAVREVSEQGRSALFGTQVEYSVFHQRGTRLIPVRQHVGITSDRVDELMHDVADHVTKEIGKA